MTVKSLIASFTQQEDLNFLLTNRVPRAALTRFMGWFSKIEQPLIRDLSIACWRLFSDLDLSEARKTSFKSLHDCFTRELKPGLRPSDPDPSIVVSPCDAIVGALRRDRRHRTVPGQGRALFAARPARRPRAGRDASQRPLRHAAADLEHVSPLSRAVRWPHRAGRFHLRRYLERQSDRAEAGRKAVLQERARGDQNPPRSRRKR